MFLQLKNLLVSLKKITPTLELSLSQSSREHQVFTISLLEYDHRFDVFDEFVYYDFENPLKLPGGLAVSHKSL